MGDFLYHLVRRAGSKVFWVTSRSIVLHDERTERDGAYILVANHQSPYEVPLLIRHSRRPLDFVSVVEMFRNPFQRRFFSSMNAFPIDRGKPDSAGVRTILERLRRGRVIAMFPEGRVRAEEDSIINGGKIRPGAGRLAVMAGVPIVPCVIINSKAYRRVASWLPLRLVRYGVNFGEPIFITPEMEQDDAAKLLEDEMRNSMIRLHGELLAAMRQRGWD